MLNQKEMISIASITILLGILVSITPSSEGIWSWNLLFITTGLVFLAIMINVIAKKIASFYLDTEIEILTWEFGKFGYKKHQKFKKPILAGIFIPLLVKFFSVGILNWMACLTFEVKGKIYKAAKRHGIYAFSNVTEEEMGIIAGIGIMANLLFALIGYLIGSPELAKINLSFALYNLIPLSNLDGSKIFFGGKILWVFLATITAIATFIAMVTI